MAILVSAHELTKSFGVRPLFQGLTFSIETGDRIGLIGPNGAGKSTLLRILASEDHADRGTLSLQKGIKVGFLKQIPEFTPGATLLSTVMEGTDVGEHLDDWERHSIAEECLAKLSLTGGEYELTTLVETLSGGWRKRVALAREIAKRPDLLLLDEPTNHLDLDSIYWLEGFLAQARFATLTITHDRAFLQKISNRIIELDRQNPGGLLNIKGDYADYLETKNSVLEAQQSRETTLKNTLRRETEWLRRGAKARTTKQQARIQRAGELAEEVGELEYRNQNRSVRLDFQSSEQAPKKLLEVKGISKSYPGNPLFEDLNLLITPKSRIGILGKNGCGKSTLIRILLGEELPDSGEVFRSDSLKPSYFEQNRETLDPEQTVLRTVCPTGDHVIYQGRSVHVRSYLDRFLFDPGQMAMAVGKLSGGEQSRLLIARLMLREANFLILDEPTNDLDFKTLNILEDCLKEFQGAILLVTHDRYFLDQVTDQILAFPMEKTGSQEILSFSGLAQWEVWRETNTGGIRNPSAPTPAPSVTRDTPKRKFTHKEQREFDQIEGSILKAEEELDKWTQESLKPEYASNSTKLAEIMGKLATTQKQVDQLYHRWTELSELKAKS